MPQPTTRNKTRKRRSQRRRPNRGQETGAAMRTQSNRSAKQTRRGRGRTRVPEMPEEQARARIGHVGEGEEAAVIVSPTGTKHKPIKRKTPRLARSRAKSPAIGRQKHGRTAKARRAQSGRADQRAGIGRRA